MFGLISNALSTLAREVHALHTQLRADADERRSARKDQEILDALLYRFARTANRISRLDNRTP